MDESFALKTVEHCSHRPIHMYSRCHAPYSCRIKSCSHW